MSVRLSFLLVVTLGGCGNDIATQPDAPPPGTPLVMVTAPQLNQAFYMTQAASVVWTVIDDGSGLVCDVDAVDGPTRISIARALAAQPNVVMTTPWPLTTVAPSDGYVAEVRCTDDSSPPMVGTGSSAVFAVVGPPQQVSYTTQVQPIWTAGCTGNACHDNVMPQARLNLTASVSRAAMVGVASTQCPSTQLVNPGSPDQSYLLFKLQGSGPCLTGGRMPKGGPALTASQLKLVRDWIVNGAPNN